MNKQMSLFPARQQPADGYRNRGLSLERALERQHEEYSAADRALIVRQYDPSVVCKFPLARIIGQAAVDYIGVLADGRVVAFDAKDCADKRLPLSRLQPHQAACLAQIEQLGGLAGVLTRFERRRVYWVPYAAWAAQMGLREAMEGFTPRPGKKSISEDELPVGWLCGGCDWLEVIERGQ